METLKESLFSLTSLNLIIKDILDFPYCYSSLCARCSTKKAIESFFHRSLKKDHQNTTYVYFQFYHPKLSSEKCFILSVNSTVLVQIALQKKQLIAFFVEHFDENNINTFSVS